MHKPSKLVQGNCRILVVQDTVEVAHNLKINIHITSFRWMMQGGEFYSATDQDLASPEPAPQVSSLS